MFSRLLTYGSGHSHNIRIIRGYKAFVGDGGHLVSPNTLSKPILSWRNQIISRFRTHLSCNSEAIISETAPQTHLLRTNSLKSVASRLQTVGRNSQNCVKDFCFRLLRRSSRSSLLISQSATAGLIVGSGLTAIISSCDHNKLFFTAQCKSKRNERSRLSHDQNNNEKVSDPSFDWKLFCKLLWKEIFFLIGAILAATGAAIVNIQIPVLLGQITNIVSKFATDATSEVSDFLFEINRPAIKLCLIYGLQGLLTFSYVSLLSIVGENIAARLRRELFQSLLKQDMKFYDTNKTGELVDRLTSDVQDFKSSFKLTISQGLKAATQTVGCSISLYMISPKLTLIMLGVIPLVIGGGTALGALLRKMSRDAQEQISKSTAVADEALGNIRTVRAFAMEDKELELYNSQVNEAKHKNILLGVGIGAFQGGANVFLNGIVLGSLYAGGWLISKHEMKAGDLISFLVATQMIERSMAQLSLLLGHVVRGLSAGARIFEYVNATADIPLRGGRQIPYHSLFGEIEFSHVKFHYPTRPEQEVLTDFNLKVPGGKMVALVGLSGGGKSTVAVLLERFYDTTGGKVTLDGVDIRNLDPSWLRGNAIGFINQEPVLFATSIMENIRYGRPEASDEEVIEAAKLANADGFIRSFPSSYSTVLGERGVTVSGGQKQRIAIARALIKNPSILVLDEATSALDAESERVVQQALDKVVKGRTVLVIAHRLSTIRDADIIAVVSKGRIVEVGSHNELKAKKGKYWDLIKKQELEDVLQDKA